MGQRELLQHGTERAAFFNMGQRELLSSTWDKESCFLQHGTKRDLDLDD
jgi:hypothetical protein